MREVLEFFARSFAPAWLFISEFEEESEGPGATERAAEATRRFLESGPPVDDARQAWLRLERLYRATGDIFGACGAFLKASEIADPSVGEISRIANLLNKAEEVKSLGRDDRVAFYGPVARLFEQHLDDLTATDCSRLAWLHLHVGDQGRALQIAERGLRLDPGNEHCRRLVEKLG